ncbi:hypothetical protein ACPEMX_19970 [Klebsiella quasipneumoniae]|uniref:hypothetical protein n=1 Tax=Klebsiella quasipneumoniae TaxID=1463165 RepID=UPI000BDCFAAB|nr:hypothetical protein [Klebsiella quasipneumoniae]PAT25112.1 hypothetical protein CJ307_15505 [Klebsiella quasipneumoniae]STR06967.1 Uncharacterised protein [Klebsiella quasipneumoniae]GMA01864.1 hypothetical protein KML003_19870 [Klebsiella quasipneumoniae subsp. similipneumoniae]HBQ3471768.1 hypothetical protein [Klebsiella quasipneumoniae subsp. similipneumoniae]HDH9989021.1 hypothetical protein [Klebsiella quasipneumoniae subsp. similipneumoniae]
MNQSDFAKLHNVSRKTVTMWKSRGWLIMSGDDIDVAASNAQLEKYRKTVNRPSKNDSQPPAKKNITPTPPIVNDRDDNGLPSLENIAKDFILENGAELSLDEARRVKENYLALLTKLEFQQKDGQLIEMTVAEEVLFNAFRQQRDSWLNWPSRVAPLMAADLGVPADRMTEVLIEHVHKHISVLGEPEFNPAED